MSSTETGGPRERIACRAATDLSSTTTPHDGSRPSVTSPDSGSWWVENPPSLATKSRSRFGGAGGALSRGLGTIVSITGQAFGRSRRSAEAGHAGLQPALDVHQPAAGDLTVV